MQKFIFYLLKHKLECFATLFFCNCSLTIAMKWLKIRTPPPLARGELRNAVLAKNSASEQLPSFSFF